jgi:hypothetical protein
MASYHYYRRRPLVYPRASAEFNLPCEVDTFFNVGNDFWIDNLRETKKHASMQLLAQYPD